MRGVLAPLLVDVFPDIGSVMERRLPSRAVMTSPTRSRAFAFAAESRRCPTARVCHVRAGRAA